MNWLVSQNSIIEKLVEENKELKVELENLSQELLNIKENLRNKNKTLMWFSLTSEIVLIIIGFVTVKKIILK